MDLKEFYFLNIQESEYHHCFCDTIRNVNSIYNVFDEEEAITKFKELCQPEKSFFDSESKCWFYLITYYLYKNGYEIKEFPRVLARPPVEPSAFTYGEIRNRIIALGNDDNGIVRYATRRAFAANLTFELKANHIGIDNSINRKFVEISNRQASFNNMSTDEKLSEIANLLENLLKKNGSFINLDYSIICLDYISNDTIAKYRKQMQCFRHATEESINERNSYSEEQKNFFVDYGLTIIKVVHSLLKQ